MGSVLNIGLVGAGRIGQMHAELLAQRIDGAALAGVYDVVGEAADQVGARFGAPVYGSAEELMAAADVDAIAICSSTDTHLELIELAAGVGKPIFCEKPLTLDLGEVHRARQAVEASGIPLMMGFNRRFDASHGRVAEAVREGTIGDVHLVRITSRDPAPPPIPYIEVSGGIFLDMTIHDFDMARFVTGSEVTEVYARGEVRVDPAIGEAGDVDTAVVVLKHDSGALTMIDNSRQAVYGYDQRVEAFGSAGMVASDNPLVATTVTRSAEGGLVPTMPYFFLERYIPSYIAEWEEFVSALGDGRPPSVGLADGEAPLVIGLAAWRSLREERPVRVDELSGA